MKMNLNIKNFASCFLIVCFIAFNCLFLSACDETKTDHIITVNSSNIRLGTTVGTGIYKTGYNVNLKATLNSQTSTFMGWLKDDVIVSYENNYSFEANQNTEGEYTALFSPQGIDFFKINKITYNLQNVNLDESTNDTLKVANFDILWNKVPALYGTFATAGEQEVFNTGILEQTDFTFKDFILFASQTYYFQVKINFESTHDSTTQTLTLSQDFTVDFSYLNKTEQPTNYTITTEEISNTTKIFVTIKNLKNFDDWNNAENPELSVIQTLTFEFVYPINSTDQDEEEE